MALRAKISNFNGSGNLIQRSCKICPFQDRHYNDAVEFFHWWAARFVDEENPADLKTYINAPHFYSTSVFVFFSFGRTFDFTERHFDLCSCREASKFHILGVGIAKILVPGPAA